MPRRALLLSAALCCGLVACGGGEDYANKPRPATPLNITAAISTKKISISPKTFGAGPIVIIISNQTTETQTLTIQTQELGGKEPGIKETSQPIDPNDTGNLKVDVRKGTYSVKAKSAVSPVMLEVGPPRKSAQDDLLEP